MNRRIRFVVGFLGGLMAALAVMAIVGMAHAQTSGFAVAPDGTVTQWGPSGGYSSGPNGTSSWDRQGGYAVEPGGGYQTWDGLIEPRDDDPALPGLGIPLPGELP